VLKENEGWRAFVRFSRGFPQLMIDQHASVLTPNSRSKARTKENARGGNLRAISYDHYFYNEGDIPYSRVLDILNICRQLGAC